MVRSERISSLGSVVMSVNGHESVPHVVCDEFAVPGDGIIDATFLTETNASLYYDAKILFIGNQRVPMLMCSNVITSNKITVTAEVHCEDTDKTYPTISKKNISNVDDFSIITRCSSMSNLSSTSDEKYDPEHTDELEQYYMNLSIATQPIEKTEIFDPQDIAYKNSFSIFNSQTFTELNLEMPSQEEVDYNYHAFSNDTISEEYNHETSRPTTAKEAISRLRLDHLDNEEREHIIKLVNKNADRFLLDKNNLGAANSVMHRIITTDDIPVNIKQYKFPLSLKDEVNKQVQEMLEAGIIKPSSSPYNSPLWIVPKKPDASGNPRWRLVSDFRALNEKTISDAYPLPDITHVIDQVDGHRYYTIMDMAQGFL